MMRFSTLIQIHGAMFGGAVNLYLFQFEGWTLLDSVLAGTFIFVPFAVVGLLWDLAPVQAVSLPLPSISDDAGWVSGYRSMSTAVRGAPCAYCGLGPDPEVRADGSRTGHCRHCGAPLGGRT